MTTLRRKRGLTAPFANNAQGKEARSTQRKTTLKAKREGQRELREDTEEAMNNRNSVLARRTEGAARMTGGHREKREGGVVEWRA